jgi:hypothetical protein
MSGGTGSPSSVRIVGAMSLRDRVSARPAPVGDEDIEAFMRMICVVRASVVLEHMHSTAPTWPMLRR